MLAHLKENLVEKQKTEVIQIKNYLKTQPKKSGNGWEVYSKRNTVGAEQITVIETQR